VVVLHVAVQVKPEQREAFVAGARDNAEHAVKDEPGCLRFDIVQDREDPDRFFFYEVYRDDAALAAHRETPHFKRYIEQHLQWLVEPAVRRLGTNVTPTDAAWR